MVRQCMIKSVVMWLHILVVSLLCVYVALFGSSSLLPNSVTYTHQQGHYQYMQPHHHPFNHTPMNRNWLF